MRYYSYRITVTRSINYLTVLITHALVNLYEKPLILRIQPNLL